MVIDVIGSKPVRMELDDATELGQLLLPLDEHVRALRVHLAEEAVRQDDSSVRGTFPGLRLVPSETP